MTAAKAFDVAARKLRGDEAHGRPCANGVVWRLNFPTEVEQAKYVRGLEQHNRTWNGRLASSPVQE